MNIFFQCRLGTAEGHDELGIEYRQRQLAARSIGNGTKHAQNAIFDDGDPELIKRISIVAAQLLGTGAVRIVHTNSQNSNFDDDDPHNNSDLPLLVSDSFDAFTCISIL